MLEHASELHEFAAAAKADGLEHAARHGRVEPRPEVIRRSYGDADG